ncbi:hypothetical protein ACHAWO_013107 [Cyclotella atomus]|uniref:MATH domain-containing protein n=1 Tax=Cyclotella atomus TaxID=382360 RepID=A0ABD3Q8K2_9STRA
MRAGEVVESPEFECAGHKWKLQLYPGGSESSMDGYIAVYLFAILPSEFSEITMADLAFNIKKSDGQNYLVDDSAWMQFYMNSANPFTFSPMGGRDMGDRFGPDDFTELNKLLDSDVLEFGTLTIEVRMRLHPDDYCNDQRANLP